jgi:hypothetical protein
MLPFALTIFTGAFLLFQVQPLIGKYILPWFGGTTGVWTTCMIFFQLALLGGYAYAHFVSRLPARKQVITHLVLLALALAMLPITPGDAWKPQGSLENPTGRILLLLAVSIGLPYFVLSSTGPLMQAWFSRLNPGVSPYRLYALSNVGSLLALVSYPFLFEPRFTRKEQANYWAVGLLLYVAFCGRCAWRLWKTQTDASAEKTSPADAEPIPSPSLGDKILWLLLPACASALLLATTNKMCQDVAVIPFLWVLPLALYLVTFIIAFDSPRWYSRWVFTIVLAGMMPFVVQVLVEGTNATIQRQVGWLSTALLVCGLVCHGELYRLKPHPRHLTSYFLMISAGGALGGLFVGLGAPLLFSNYYEYHWALLATALLLAAMCLRDAGGCKPWQWLVLGSVSLVGACYGLDRFLKWAQGNLGAKSWISASALQHFKEVRYGLWGALGVAVVLAIVFRHWTARRNWRLITCAVIFVGCISLGLALWQEVHSSDKNVIFSTRNFYGVMSVFEYGKNDSESHYFLLQHGRITHGLQFADKEAATWPTSYYTRDSGIGLAFEALSKRMNRKLGVLGLGTGSITVYGRAGDTWRIYEINPAVTNLARTHFSYLANCKAKVELAMGDGRLTLENELKRGESQQFDFLALDAFSSDAIPVHLITEEAIKIYRGHLKKDGVLAVHISNRYLNLEPVVENIANHFGFKSAMISHDDAGEEWWVYGSTWVLLTDSEEFVNFRAISDAATEPKKLPKPIPLWTDDYASLFPIIQ